MTFKNYTETAHKGILCKTLLTAVHFPDKQSAASLISLSLSQLALADVVMVYGI